jgi:Na+/proline symporter/signal transduction histidine kinase
MNFIKNVDIDIVIVIGFLILNLCVGLYYGRGVKNISDYAVGNKKTYTSIISASIIATWISGSFFTVSISQTFTNGVWFVPAAIGDIISLLIIGYILAPKMKEFLNHLSVAESMGEMYGNKIRYVTAIASIAQSIAMTALQIKVFSGIFSYFLGVSSIPATVISSFVVIFYSAWGGIKAVSITDALQLCTFGIFIPLFALFIWKTIGDTDATRVAFQTNPLLDFTQLLNYKDPRFLPNMTLMLWFLIPSLNSPTFQRTLMSRDTDQINKSFSLAAIGYTVIMIFICIIGLLILAIDPGLDDNNIVPRIIDKHSFIGLKGITVIGIMAMVMSTADSWINVGSVILTHDICKPLGLKKKNELIMSRIFALIIGFSSVLLVLYSSSIFKLFSLQANFYMPIVTMPLLFAILGFRTTPNAVGGGMIAGVATVVIWKLYLTKETGIDSVVPAMLANLFTFFIIHYLFKQNGGWVKNKDKNNKDRKSVKTNLVNLLDKIYNFDILGYSSRALPKSNNIYNYFSIAVFLTIITTLSIEKDVYNNNLYLINIFQALVLCIAIFFLSNAIWSNSFKQHFLGIIWYICLFMSLIFTSSFLVLLSKFSHVSLTILTMHLIFVSILVGWRAAFVMIPIGIWSSFASYQGFIGDLNPYGIYNLKLKLLYVLVMVGGFSITILKSKQDQQEETEVKVDTLGNEVTHLTTEVTDLNEKVDHYSERVSDQEKEIERLGATAQKILNNVNHELRLPVGNVMNFAEMLNEGLGKFNESQLKMLSDEVYKNSNRLSSMIMNMLDLAALEAKNLELDKRMINLGELVRDRVQSCRKMYLDNKKIDFEMQIEEEILIKVDPNYIRQTVDNLVINAINFSQKGFIKISLLRKNNIVEFVIKDEGMGIPQKDIYDIFTPFKMGSNTESKAEGRGGGLALCKAAIEAHGGIIKGESKGEKGAIFRFVLSLDSK